MNCGGWCYLQGRFFLLSLALQSHLFTSSTTYRSRPVGVAAADHKRGFMDIFYSAAIDCGGQPARPPPPPSVSPRETSMACAAQPRQAHQTPLMPPCLREKLPFSKRFRGEK